MQKVSDSFRQAIKADNREIKGYVEITYAMGDNSGYYALSAPQGIRYSDTSEMFDGKRKCNKYATLESDYTQLDGSYFLPNYNIKNDNAGYVSEDIFSEVEMFNINIKNTTLPWTTKGITFYFNHNIPVNFTIIINGNDVYEITDNDKSVFQLILEEETMVKYINIDIAQVEYPNRRIRISEIDLGITNLYEGQDLVSFSTTEEIDLLMTSTPTNEITINLNNYNNQFDPINPTGIVEYLTEDCIIKPYIGVLTENGEEYVGIGTYYLTDWSSNTDGNVTINGKNLMSIISNLTLKSDGQLFDKGSSHIWVNHNFSDYLSNLYNINFDMTFRSFLLWYTQTTKLLDIIQALAAYSQSYGTPKKLYVSRDDKLVYEDMKTDVVEQLNRTELLDDVKYETQATTNNIIVNTTGGATFGDDSDELLSTTYTLTSKEEYVWFSLSTPGWISGDSKIKVTSDDGVKATIIDYNFYLVYLKFKGNVNSTVTIKITGGKLNRTETKLAYSTSDTNQNTLELDYTNNIRVFSGLLDDDFYNFYIKYSKPYKISASYIGNPTLEPGDTISVETKYGYKNMIITKQSLTFNGGLQGTIEGIGD